MSYQFPAAKRYRRRRRWVFKKHAGVKWLSALILVAVAVTVTIVLAYGEAKGVNNPADADLAQGAPTVSASTAVVSVSPTETPQATFSKKPAEGFLVLVNLENPIASEERPTGLVTMGTLFNDDLVLANPDGSINQVAGEAAKAMFQAAQEEGIGKYIITSAYRSISYQDTLFQARLEQDPDFASDPYANPIRVMPGKCSEHTTGLAVDILAENYREADDGYADSEEGKWLQKNAHRFGFVLRYPKDKEHITGVIYEPWHFRYVGVEAATEMYELGLCLEEYVYIHEQKLIRNGCRIIQLLQRTKNNPVGAMIIQRDKHFNSIQLTCLFRFK